MKFERWIIRNLELFGNCLIPKRLIQMYGEEVVQIQLSDILKKKVEVKKEWSNYVSEGCATIGLNLCQKPKKKVTKDYNYIARVKE